ncbi:MAG: hypothetical protein QXH08_06345 [Candidatus Hadarchaeales archaeon]
MRRIFLCLTGLILLFYGGCYIVAFLIPNAGKYIPRFFSSPVSLILKWQELYHEEMDPRKALPFITKAVLFAPHRGDLLIQAAGTLEDAGDRGRANQLTDWIFSRLSRVTTWKWDEFLLALRLGREGDALRIYEFMLKKLPHRTLEATYALTSDQRLLSFILKNVSPRSIDRIIESAKSLKSRDVFYALAERFLEDPSLKVGNGYFDLIDYLLWGFDDLKLAQELWNKLDRPLLHDGGFEDHRINHTFHWTILPMDNVRAVVGIVTEECTEGDRCLKITFQGENVHFHHVQHIVSIPKERSSCLLRYLFKVRELESDVPIRIAVFPFRCKDAKEKLAAGVELNKKGGGGWEEDEITFTLPETCSTINIVVTRERSPRFGGAVKGELHLDGFHLECR